MLYGSEAIKFAAEYIFACLEIFDEKMQEYVQIVHSEVGPNKTYEMPKNPEDLRVDDQCIYYINSYLVTKHYGSRAEGGDWYLMGEPLESIQIDVPRRVKALRNARERFLKKIYEYGNINSVLGGQEVRTEIEYTFAEPFPTEPYRYE